MKENSPLSNDVRALQALVNYNLKELKECVATVYEMLRSRRNSEELVERLKRDEIDYADQVLRNTDFAKLTFRFPKILESSLFIGLYAFLENVLLGLCEEIRTRRGYLLGVSDLRDKGVLGARTYIKKLAGFCFPDESPHWRDIDIYRRIRNCIVHRDGEIREGDYKLEKGIKDLAKKGRSVDLAGGQIGLFEGFCVEFIDSTDGFLKELFGGIIEKKQAGRSSRTKRKRRPK